MKKMAALLAGILMMAATSAWATPTLRLFDGTSTKTVADGSIDDLNPLAGVVLYSGALGSWIVNVETGITKPTAGTALDPYMDLNSSNTSTAAGSLHVLFSETGFISNANVSGFTTAVGGTTQG